MKDAPMVLALETSTEICSAALTAGGRIEECTLTVPREHTRHILGQVDELLGKAGGDGRRPCGGGVRPRPGDIHRGAGGHCSWRRGWRSPMACLYLPVSSLAALAWRAWHEHQVSPVLAVMDARLEEVYWAMFEVGDEDSFDPASGIAVGAGGTTRAVALVA